MLKKKSKYNVKQAYGFISTSDLISLKFTNTNNNFDIKIMFI